MNKFSTKYLDSEKTHDAKNTDQELGGKHEDIAHAQGPAASEYQHDSTYVKVIHICVVS